MAKVEIPTSLIAGVVYEFNRLAQASNISEQASAYTRLFNTMSDLATWHPAYDYRTGEIQFNEEELL